MSEYDNSNNEIVLEEVNDNKKEFWGKNPNVLFADTQHFFPTEDMSYDEKLNAITRLILIITILAFIVDKKFSYILICGVTIGFIFLYHHYNNEMLKEKFENPVDEIVEEHDINTEDVFDEPTSINPFGNVLVTDIGYNPNKKPAPPSYNNNINENIINESKRMVQELNPDQPDISDKLFKDLGEQLTFEQSLRQFNSNPNTQVVNDQTGFAEFCYGSMVSCKEGNLFACARNLNNYNLY